MTSTPQRESNPAWSPDGAQIAYLRTNGDMHDLMVMPAVGGPARSIKAGIRLFNGWGYGGLLAWTPDGRWLVVGTQVDGVRGIWLFAADRSARRRLTTGRDWAPRFASDGRRMVFIRELPPKRGQLLMVVLDATQEPEGPQ